MDGWMDELLIGVNGTCCAVLSCGVSVVCAEKMQRRAKLDERANERAAFLCACCMDAVRCGGYLDRHILSEFFTRTHTHTHTHSHTNKCGAAINQSIVVTQWMAPTNQPTNHTRTHSQERIQKSTPTPTDTDTDTGGHGCRQAGRQVMSVFWVACAEEKSVPQKPFLDWCVRRLISCGLLHGLSVNQMHSRDRRQTMVDGMT
mmetsp:Transcript_35050/g.87059  ORF Transcript_35050/g.87059 Transcript_35050/m.87059 type:complete len:202 (+) Transcript_35050:55-660(+)